MATTDELNRVKDTETSNIDVVGGDNALRGLLSKEYKDSQDAVRYFSLDWDEYEDLLFVQSRSQDGGHVRISEGTLSTIVIERAGRVMHNLPIGHVDAFGLGNRGKGQLMDLLLEKHIYPNANEQYDLETKLFLWDMYSNVYGTMAMCYDWTVSDNYTGPDCWLVPMRNFFPQQGRLSIKNCDFVYISTFVSRQWFLGVQEDAIAEYDLDAIEQVLEKTAHGAVKPKARDDYLRTNPMFEARRRAPLTDTGDIEVVTKYESGNGGRWISFCPDFDNIVIRNIENPHQNGRIPVVLKYGLPTLDSIIGLGDMEKGRYIQYGMDTTINLQLDGQKLRTYPPIKVVNGNVVMPTIRFQPGAKWLVSNPNDVSHHQFPDIEDSYNLTYQFLKGSLTNVLGDSSTQASAEANSAQQGKTPEAIRDSQQSQSTRDAIDTKFMCKAITELVEGFCDLMARKQSEPIKLYGFGEEVLEIAANYPDIKDMIKFDSADPKDARTAEITVKPSAIKNDKGYRYSVDPTSTAQQDQEKEHDQLNEILTSYVENAQQIEALLNAAGQTVDFGQMYKRWLQSGGFRDWKSIMKPYQPPTPEPAVSDTQDASGAAMGPTMAPAASPGAVAGPAMMAATQGQAANGEHPEVTAAKAFIASHGIGGSQ